MKNQAVKNTPQQQSWMREVVRMRQAGIAPRGLQFHFAGKGYSTILP